MPCQHLGACVLGLAMNPAKELLRPERIMLHMASTGPALLDGHSSLQQCIVM